MMDVLVLGANGRTGREVVSRLLDGGHSVTAMVRSEDRWSDEVHDRLRVEVGRATDPNDLARLSPGHDAVISLLGPRWPSKAACEVYEASGSAFAAVLPELGPKRLLVTSSGLLFSTKGWFAGLLRRMVPSVVSAAGKMEDHIRGSDLDWTIVRTGFLNDGAATDCRVAVEQMPEPGGAVSRSAVAALLVRTLEHRDHVHTALGVSGPR